MFAGLGLFCFDGALLRPFDDRTSLAPDCFLIGVSAWIQPKTWLLANLLASAALGIWAQVAAYGFLRGRAWAPRYALCGAIPGIAFFAALAAALPQFQLIGLGGAALLTCTVVAYVLGRRFAGGRIQGQV